MWNTSCLNRRSRRVEGRLKKLCFLRGGGACLLPQDKKLGGGCLKSTRLLGSPEMLRPHPFVRRQAAS